MIDMHAHWRPAEVMNELRERTREPRIVRRDDGVEVIVITGSMDGYSRDEAKEAITARGGRASRWPP